MVVCLKGKPVVVILLDKRILVDQLPYDILMQSTLIDETDFTWNADKTLATQVFKKDGSTVLTLTYTWNADGTLEKVVRT